MFLRVAAACSALLAGPRVPHCACRAPLRNLAACASSAVGSSIVTVIPDEDVAALPSQWVVFSDLHVRQDTLSVCLELLREVEAAARARAAGVIFLGDFWHAGTMLSTRHFTGVRLDCESYADVGCERLEETWRGASMAQVPRQCEPRIGVQRGNAPIGVGNSEELTCVD